MTPTSFFLKGYQQAANEGLIYYEPLRFRKVEKEACFCP